MGADAFQLTGRGGVRWTAEMSILDWLGTLGGVCVCDGVKQMREASFSLPPPRSCSGSGPGCAAHNHPPPLRPGGADYLSGAIRYQQVMGGLGFTLELST